MDEEMEEPKVPERRSLTGSENGMYSDASFPSVSLRDEACDSCQRRAVAAYSYYPVHPDELQLQVGDIVEILGEVEEDWWRGRLRGEIGVFPTNFVKVLDDSTKIEVPSGSSHEDGTDKKRDKCDGVPGDNQVSISASSQSLVATSAGQKESISDAKVPSGATTSNQDVVAVVDWSKPESTSKEDSSDEKSNPPVSPLVRQPSKNKGSFASDVKNDVEVEKTKVKPSFSAGLPPTLPPKPPKSKSVIHPSPEPSKRIPADCETKPDSPTPDKLEPIATEKMDNVASPKSTSKSKAAECNIGKPSSRTSSPARAEGTKAGKLNSSLIENAKNLSSRLFMMGRGKSPARNGSVQSSENKPDDDFGCTTGPTESLSHLTTDRPKNKNRRPPSQSFLQQMAVAQPALADVTSNKATSVVFPKATLPALPSCPPKPARSPTPGTKDYGKTVVDSSKSEYVRRDEFQHLLAAFEAYRRETADQIKELEKRLLEREKLEKL